MWIALAILFLQTRGSQVSQVTVAPQQWHLSAAVVRQVGAQRGYQEGPPPAPGLVAFSYAPAVVAQQTAVQRDRIDPAQQSRHRERVVHELAHTDFAWVRVSEIGTTLDEANAFAAQYGAAVLRVYGNRLDPVLLFGKRDIGRLQQIVQPAVNRSQTSARRSLIRNLVTASAVIVLLALVVMFALAPLPAVGWTLLGLGPVLIALAVVPFVVSAASGTTTDRMTKLIQEFDGRGRVPIISRQFKLDRLTYLDVAAELGYAYSNHWNSLRPTSRWYEGWTIFVPVGQPGGLQ